MVRASDLQSSGHGIRIIWYWSKGGDALQLGM